MQCGYHGHPYMLMADRCQGLEKEETKAKRIGQGEIRAPQLTSQSSLPSMIVPVAILLRINAP